MAQEWQHIQNGVANIDWRVLIWVRLGCPLLVMMVVMVKACEMVVVVVILATMEWAKVELQLVKRMLRQMKMKVKLRMGKTMKMKMKMNVTMRMRMRMRMTKMIINMKMKMEMKPKLETRKKMQMMSEVSGTVSARYYIINNNKEWPIWRLTREQMDGTVLDPFHHGYPSTLP